VHNFGSRKKNADAHLSCRIPILKVFGWKICWNLQMCGGILFTSTEVVHRPRSDSSLYFWYEEHIANSYGKYKMPAVGVCCPQPCSSAGHRFAASRPGLHYYRRIVSFPQEQIRWYAWYTGFHWESPFVQEMPNPTLRRWKHTEKTRMTHPMHPNNAELRANRVEP